MPYFVNDIGFINKDPKYIRQWMNRWFEMKRDWEKNKDRKVKKGEERYKFPMTDAYAPYPAPFAPDEYGIVILDLQKNYVLSSNHYSSFGGRDLISYEMERPSRRNYEWVYDNDKKESVKKKVHDFSDDDQQKGDDASWWQFKAMFDAGKIKAVEYVTRRPAVGEKKEDEWLVEGSDRWVKDDPESANDMYYGPMYRSLASLKIKTWQQMVKFHIRASEHDRMDYKGNRFPRAMRYVFDMSPFRVINYDSGVDGMKQLKEQMHELGFTLTDEEEHKWQSWMRGEKDMVLFNVRLKPKKGKAKKRKRKPQPA